MEKNLQLSFYNISKQIRSGVHSAGPDIYFERPCIGYVTKGYAKFLYEGKTVYAYEGDLIYIGCDTRYQSIWYGSPDIEWYSLNFEFVQKYTYYNHRFQILKDYPGEIFEKMYASKNNALLFISYIYALLSDVYTKTIETPTTKHYSPVEVAIRYIEEHYNESFEMDIPAKLCHMGRTAFFKQFKKATGVTPVNYKHNIMIQHAIDLLSGTDLSVEEVSVATGFSSSNYFRTVFYKLTDKTPKDIRKHKSDG